ncbi:hypothetical protein [Streptomyces laurentii]|uniref:hypothetical protein n=1 Tax=Streptomyces laurentii TaxID=39478 RepID=UPI00340ACA8D
MDAGLAAVLGAVAGASGAVGAGLVTGISQWKTAKFGARAEHTRQRREFRQASYRKFIEAHWAFAEIVDSFYFEQDPTPEIFTSQTADRLEEAMKGVQTAFLDVALAGPKEVAHAAEEQNSTVRVTAKRFHEIALCYAGADGYESDAIPGFFQSLQGATAMLGIRDFLDVAPIALDNDGSDKRRG